ncbi:phosphopantetheine-binding protein [Streptomyces sp. NPDC056661]|uniref:phosphopantetheine-binding protein n=1 Tax=Streptomyces sp. NPDC056661 TaxID=3345898 RepID=UPI0036AF1A9B
MTEAKRSAFEAKLREFLPLLPPDSDLRPDTDLAAHGLDSLATVALLVDLEDTFDVQLPDDQLSASTFETVDSLWRVMATLTNESRTESDSQ